MVVPDAGGSKALGPPSDRAQCDQVAWHPAAHRAGPVTLVVSHTATLAVGGLLQARSTIDQRLVTVLLWP